MTKNKLKEEFAKEGIESAHLDEITHDAASQLASSANNGGLDDQIDFLLDTCGWTAEDILQAIKK